MHLRRDGVWSGSRSSRPSSRNTDACHDHLEGRRVARAAETRRTKGRIAVADEMDIRTQAAAGTRCARSRPGAAPRRPGRPPPRPGTAAASTRHRSLRSRVAAASARCPRPGASCPRAARPFCRPRRRRRYLRSLEVPDRGGRPRLTARGHRVAAALHTPGDPPDALAHRQAHQRVLRQRPHRVHPLHCRLPRPPGIAPAEDVLPSSSSGRKPGTAQDTAGSP